MDNLTLTPLLKGSFIYGIGKVLNRFLVFLLMPLFTRYLTPEDYGIMAMLAVLSVFLTGVFSLGTGSSMSVCYFETESKKERCNIIWTTVLLVSISSFFFLYLGYIFSSKISLLLYNNPNYAHLIFLSLASLALSIITQPFDSYFRMEERAKTVVIISGISVFSLLILSFFSVVILGRGVQGMLESALIGSFITLLITASMVLDQLKPRIKLSWIKQLIRIGYPSILGLGAFFLIDWADRAMIQRMLGLSELGVYNLGYSFGLVMSILAEGAFGSAWPPYFMKFINRRKEAALSFGKILKYYTFLFGLISLIFFVFAELIISIMAEKSFFMAYTVVGIISFSYMLKVVYLIFLPGFYFEKKIHLQTGIEWIAAFINVGLNFLLIPIFKMPGAAISTLISYIILIVFAYLLGNKFLRVKYEWGPIIKFIPLFIIVAGLSFFHYTNTILINTIINIMIFFTVCLILFFHVLNQIERRKILTIVLKLHDYIVRVKR